MAKISRDLAAGNLHPRENIFATGNLAVLNAVVTVAADGAATVMVGITGTYVGTITVEGSIDSTNWEVIPIKPVSAGGIYVLTLASATIGRWAGLCAGFSSVRVRMSAYTSGTAAVTAVSDVAPMAIEVFVRATDQAVTATGTAAAAVTLTIPSGGAGTFHYITRVLIQRFATVLLTAAATPVLVTTTNLPGTRVFSIPADAAALGSVATIVVEAAAPMRSSAAATATTIVAPATAATIWRITADYFTAP